jgi:hypothetical protein
VSEVESRISRLIPYRNPKALIGYYISFIGLIPLIGFPFGVAAIALAILGLRDEGANSKVRGSIHAVVALVFGILSVTLCLDIGILILIVLYIVKNF